MCNEAGLAAALYIGIVQNGGATVTVELCEHGNATFKIASGAQPDGGYMIALFPEPLAVVPMQGWSPMTALWALRELSTNEQVNLLLGSDPFGGLGFWVDPATDLLHLDAVEMYQDLTVALALAASRGQKAIYDLALGQDVLVP